MRVRRWHAVVPLLALALAACADAVTSPGLGYLLDGDELPDHLRLVHQTDEYALLLGAEGRVANLVLRNFRYEHQRADDWGRGEAEYLGRVVSSHFQDVFDFILFTYDERYPREALPYGLYLRVRLRVDGLAIGLSDSGRRYGSLSRLKGLVMLRSQDNLIDGPSLHEITHHWGQNLLRDGLYPRHWGAAGVGGQLGGWTPGTLTQRPDGSWTGMGPTGKPFGFIANGGNHNVPYAPLELYLMGLLPADSVPPVRVAVSPTVVDERGGVFTADGFEWFDLRDHIATFGPRLPGYPDAPTAFRGIYLILTRRSPLPEDDWRRATADVERFSRPGPDGADEMMNFWEATGGRGTFRLDGLDDLLSL